MCLFCACGSVAVSERACVRVCASAHVCPCVPLCACASVRVHIHIVF